MPAVVIAGFTAALYAGVLPGLIRDWSNDPGQSQGFLIPPLAACLAWIDKKRILETRAVTDNRGLLAVLAGCLLFLAGKLAAEFFVARFSLVVLLTGLIWAFWGLERLRKLALPLLLLVTMIPIPSVVQMSISTPLQLFASKAGTTMARAFGVAIHQDGNVINLANISLGVTEACSGLHSLSALVVTGLVLAFITPMRPIFRAAMVISAVPVSIAMNVLRVTGTALLADFDERYAMGFYHSFSGWLVFVSGFACLVVLTKACAAFSQRGFAK